MSNLFHLQPFGVFEMMVVHLVGKDQLKKVSAIFMESR